MSETQDVATSTPNGADATGLGELLALGASTVYEGSGLDCWIDPRIRPIWKGARVAGPAFTARAAPGDNLAVQRAVREGPAGSVLVVDGGGLEFGYWGGILTEIAALRRMAGLVINGTVRDVDEIEQARFPVFATGVAMRHARKRDPGTIGEPITVGDRVIRSGDVVVADSDGVVVLPGGAVQAALAGARARADKERMRVETIRAGEVPPMTAEETLC